MARAAMRPTSSFPARSAAGAERTNTALSARYRTVTIAVPRISDRGIVRSGSRISPPTYTAAFHPE